ncbi:hypothetical protein HY994_01160 [Candidatus Micrarchaeota archaeon]|nr:hypothetical protein [Candidatus Micrarchaeota archaeon]
MDERDMPFTPSVSYYNFQGSIFQSEFQGMAPASDGGIYSYYRLYSIDFSNSLTSGATSKNSSRLYMVKIDQNGKVQNEYAFPNSVSVVAEDSIRFTGQSRGRQYFSENRNLYYSEDGGKTLNPQGYSSYLIRQWTGNWVAPHCEGTAPVTTITLSGTTDDVVDPSPLKYVSVAGGKTVALMKYFPFPLVQQNDGYFINPEMIYDSLPLQYPWLNPIKKYDSVYYDIKYGKAGFWSDWQITYKKSLDQYFQDPFFNKEFFGRFFIQNLNKWVRKYAGSRVDSTSSSSQKTLFTTRSNKVLSSRENDAVSDSQGNLHFLFSAEPYVSGKYSLELYYQFYPAIAFDHTIKTKPSPQVYLISTTNCPSCQTATGWLQQGKITYQPISDMAGITWPESIKTAVNTQLEKTNDGLILVMNADTDYNLIPAGDYIQIASRFGVILDPIRVSVLPDTYYSLDDVDPLTPKIHVTEQGVPIITSNSKELLPQMFQYEYAIGQWKIKKLDLDFTGYSRGLSAVSDLAWYNLPFNSGFISNYVGAKYINFNEYAPYDSTSASQFELPQGDFQSKSLEIPFLVTKGYETVGEFYPDDPRHTQKSITSFTQLHRVNYRVYSSVLTEKLGDEPSADATLSELVPFQKFNLPIPLDSDSTPSLSLSSDLSGGSSSVELTPDEDSGTYSATVTLDARSLWKGGNIDIPRDKITGKVTAKFGKQSVDMPFTVSVKHIQPNHLAYVSPESVTFYASNGKSVKKTLFLTNNYAQSLTFSCGSVFSKAVSGKSIVMVEIAPVDATTACSVTINTYPSGQQLTFERQELVSDTSWAEEDVLAEPAKEQARSLHFTDCANGYCNCGQATAALTDFENSVLSRANAVSSHASDDSISTLYPSGYKETTLLRTGVFDDLDDESLGICAGSLAGWGVDLKPGRVYQLSLNIPQSSGRLFLGSITPDTPKELLKPFSYATQSGIQVNQDTFVRMTEVR